MDDNNTSSVEKFVEELHVEGINYLGFGIIPKFIMLDKDLPIESKGLYAYLASFSGNGRTAYPSRSRIMYDLKIAKNTYYKYFNILLQEGYITVRQIKGDKQQFGKNIYTLVANPKKLQLRLETERDTASKIVLSDRIISMGLKVFGYGMIPKAVMIDPRMPLRTKAIYALFCSFSGAGNSAFPPVSQIKDILMIPESAYYKYFRFLTKLNYISVKQRRINGKMDVNDYYLIDTPHLDNLPTTQFCDTVKSLSNTDHSILRHGENGENDAVLEFPDAEILEISTDCSNLRHGENSLPTTQFCDTEKWDTEKCDTKSNIIKSNTNKSITHSLPNPPKAPPEHDAGEIEGEREIDVVRNEVKKEICLTKGIPYAYKLDELRMTEAIHFMTDWQDLHPRGYKDQLRQSIYDLFNEALIQMCMASQMSIKGSYVTYAKVIKRVNERAEYTDHSADLSDFTDAVIENYYTAASATKIKNPLKYMQSCIWDMLLTGNINMYASLKREFGI